MTKLDDLDARIKAALDKQDSGSIVPTYRFSDGTNKGMRAFMEMLGVLLGSGFMGWALDSYLKTSPTFLLIFVILGIIAAFLNVYKLSKNLGTAIGSNRLQSAEKAARKPSQNESD